MSGYHPNLDGPAEPIGLTMALDDKKAQSSLAQAPGSESPTRNYPVECPNCGLVLHQGHAEIYGECLLCGIKVKPNKQVES
jgi:hypothetical protein